MKNKIIFAVGLILIFIVVIFIYERSQASLYDEPEEEAKGEESRMEYVSITMDEAMKEFETQENYIIVDVRRADEYATGHIPNAINIANEDISDTEPKELNDKNQKIYVYCRSGNRSKQAAEKLVKMGYVNVIEFGGIIDWNGEIEK